LGKNLTDVSGQSVVDFSFEVTEQFDDKGRNFLFVHFLHCPHLFLDYCFDHFDFLLLLLFCILFRILLCLLFFLPFQYFRLFFIFFTQNFNIVVLLINYSSLLDFLFFRFFHFFFKLNALSHCYQCFWLYSADFLRLFRCRRGRLLDLNFNLKFLELLGSLVDS
jgi:hypothetical protein